MNVNKYEGDQQLLKMFISDIKKTAVLSREDEYRIAKQAQAGDEEAFKHLIASNLRFVIKVALSYSGYRHLLMDLISAGCLGLIVAAKTFDPDRGFRFISYAECSVRQRIVLYIKDYRHHELSSLDEPAFEEGDKITLKDTLVSDCPSTDERYFNGQVRDLLGNLKKRETRIVKLRFWDDKTTDEVGRLIQLSRSRIAQIEARALRKLRWIIYERSGNYGCPN
jgi:RNA polymerase sigma factor (sigma-70 family)